MNELEAIKAVRDGILTSPHKHENMHLFDIRITGTGVATRSDGEIAVRSFEKYLNDDFLERCNGLPVILEHPDGGLLSTESFQKQIIGTVVHPYIKDSDVWGIAKIYDDEVAGLMAKGLSTSPAVTLSSEDSVKLGNVLFEGEPQLLDHVAVVLNGVWDKDAGPSGIRVDSINDEKGAEMNAEEMLKMLTDTLGTFSAGIESKLDAISVRVDGFEKAMKEKETKEDKKEEETKDDKKACMADSDKDKEQNKVDGMDGDDGDDDEDDKEGAAQQRGDKKKADAFAVHETEINSLKEELARLKARSTGLSMEDRNKMAEAQAKADSLSMALGDRSISNQPYTGESVIEYRKRIAAKFAAHTADWKDVKLDSLDESVFNTIENKIYADALNALKTRPATPGKLQMIKVPSLSGHEVYEPAPGSDPNVWLDSISHGYAHRASFKPR